MPDIYDDNGYEAYEDALRAFNQRLDEEIEAWELEEKERLEREREVNTNES